MALKDQKEVLIAWINGETLQYQNSNGTWSDCAKFCEVDSIRLDSWTYRIKPKEIVTTTLIKRDLIKEGLHLTYSLNEYHPANLRLTWAEDGKKLLKAEVIG
jgi:hypothetical protein